MIKLLNVKPILRWFLWSLVAPVQRYGAEELHSLCRINGRIRTVSEKQISSWLGAQEWAGSGCRSSLGVASAAGQAGPRKNVTPGEEGDPGGAFGDAVASSLLLQAKVW